MTHKLNVPFEIKSLNKREIEGHGSVFGNIDLGGDIVVPGAFQKSLNEHQQAGSLPAMLWMHDMAQVPGKWTDMSEDSKGLHVKGEFVDTPLGNEIRTLLLQKAIRGLSIGYTPNDIDYRKDGTRLLKEVSLFEVSVVSLAMNPLAQVEGIKSRLSIDGEYVPTAREFEQFLRDSGYCSKKAAITLSAKIYGDGGILAPRRDSGDEDEEAMTALRDFNSMFKRT